MLIQTTRIIGIFCAGKGCFQALLFFFLCCFFVAAPSVAAPGNFALDFTTIRLGDDAQGLTQAIPANVELHNRDVAEGFAVTGADALFLDVRTPWEYLDHALAAVRPGASFGFLLPTVDQVSKLLLGLERGPFADVEVCEILIRRWKPVADRLRPEDRMTAHTGFLVFARQQDRSADFDSRKPMGTRERKQEAARQARLGLTDEAPEALEGDME